MREPGQAGRSGIERLLDVVRALRSEGGCPWDREQTHESLKPLLLEEAYELLDAIDSRDPGRVRDELGDVLLQVVLHSRMGEETGDFTFDDVASHLCEKLVRRHPHVFSNVVVADSREVLANWEAIKAEERTGSGSGRSALEGVPRELPALQRAQRIQSRAARVGFDWEDESDVAGKIREELDETTSAMESGHPERVKEELGDLLFAVVNLARFRNVNAEDALRRTIEKFTRRFKEVERRVLEKGRAVADCTLEQLDAHWEDVKKDEDDPGET